MGDWLYPISPERGGHYFVDRYGRIQPTTFDAFVDTIDDLVHTGQNVVEWTLEQNGFKALTSDPVWILSCWFNRHGPGMSGVDGVCGLAEIEWLDPDNYRIGLRFDLAATALLIAKPFPGPELRMDFGYGKLVRNKSALTRLDPARAMLLEHRLATLRKFGTGVRP
jgi:hypothetical protein